MSKSYEEWPYIAIYQPSIKIRAFACAQYLYFTHNKILVGNGMSTCSKFEYKIHDFCTKFMFCPTLDSVQSSKHASITANLNSLIRSSKRAAGCCCTHLITSLIWLKWMPASHVSGDCPVRNTWPSRSEHRDSRG